MRRSIRIAAVSILCFMGGWVLWGLVVHRDPGALMGLPWIAGPYAIILLLNRNRDRALVSLRLITIGSVLVCGSGLVFIVAALIVRPGPQAGIGLVILAVLQWVVVGLTSLSSWLAGRRRAT